MTRENYEVCSVRLFLSTKRQSLQIMKYACKIKYGESIKTRFEVVGSFSLIKSIKL